jgi:hypothetical protein
MAQPRRSLHLLRVGGGGGGVHGDGVSHPRTTASLTTRIAATCACARRTLTLTLTR